MEKIDKLSEIILLKPKFDKSKSVFQTFKRRQTMRELADRKLSLQCLSNLLWAACGVNRKSGPFDLTGRTAASASNSQEIDIYVSMENGTYLYNAKRHCLKLILTEDIRKFAIGKGQRKLGDLAPVRLIYVADIFKLSHTAGYQEPGLQDPEVQKSYYFVDTGIIAGNVYLFTSSQGLACWFHNCNKFEIEKKLELTENQKVLFGQTIGFPAKKKLTNYI